MAPAVSRQAARALGGAARLLTTAARGMTLDAVAAAGRIAQGAHSVVTGTEYGLATLPVHVVILSDESGRPLTTADRIAPALATAGEVLRHGAGIRVRVTGIDTVSGPAPTEALDPRANRRLLLDDLLGRTAFYRRHSADRPWHSVVGDPVTVVVVRTIAGRATGCSLGMSADWVICQANLFDPTNPRTYDETVLPHELGHALNLPHLRDRRNLMHPISSPPKERRGTELRRWQSALLHANRHVIPASVRAVTRHADVPDAAD